MDHRLGCYASGSQNYNKAQVAPCTMDPAAFGVSSPAIGWSVAVPLGPDLGAFASSGLLAVAVNLCWPADHKQGARCQRLMQSSELPSGAERVDPRRRGEGSGECL